MKTLSRLTLAAACTFAVLLPIARADEWNKETKFTFSGPVEIPGQTLPAGTYVFKLLDSKSDRNVVQIFNEREDHLYATVLTINDYRLEPKGKTVLMFDEREANAPQAIKAWFYPGDVYGNEFVYGKVRATALAKATQQPVPSMPEPAPVETAQAQPVAPPADTVISAQQPSGDQVEVAQVFQTQPTPEPAQPATTDTATTDNTPAPVLPATASDTPLIALLGTLGMLAGGFLVFGTRRQSI